MEEFDIIYHRPTQYRYHLELRTEKGGEARQDFRVRIRLSYAIFRNIQIMEK